MNTNDVQIIIYFNTNISEKGLWKIFQVEGLPISKGLNDKSFFKTIGKRIILKKYKLYPF